MAEYSRKDIIVFTDNPRLKNAIGKQVYGDDSPTDLLTLANYGDPNIFCETLVGIHKHADSRPFETKFEGTSRHKHYDVIIIKKDEEKNDG